MRARRRPKFVQDALDRMKAPRAAGDPAVAPDPLVLTTRDCADLLGVSTAFIRGEIDDGRLVADVYDDDEKGRRIIRIDRTDFIAYCKRYWPAKGQKLAG